ncbi:hypothetical protein LXL04_032454 [Taraxacum kok-saghyz]
MEHEDVMEDVSVTANNHVDVDVEVDDEANDDSVEEIDPDSHGVESTSTRKRKTRTLKSETVVERFRRLTLEAYGSSAKSRLPLPATTGQWSSNDPNTLLRVLCYRNDDSASKFLKKTYNLPKKL